MPLRRIIRRRKLPINLLRKLKREERHKKLKKAGKRKTQKRRKVNNDLQEHETLVLATQSKLRRILQNDEFLTDIPFDITSEELLGELAIVNGHATTIYVERDGLSTLTIVLYKHEPTIANLKRAIENQTRVQLQREWRERQEERTERRRRLKLLNVDDYNYEMLELLKPIRSTGELVHSTARCGHKHRSRVSWRFLWRVYCLYNVVANVPVNDQNGRQLLSECGIGNTTRLKFSRRNIYFPRQRQNKVEKKREEKREKRNRK